MKKNRKLTFIILTFFLSFCFSIINIKASGSATVGISGDSAVYSGNTITVRMYVSNVANTSSGVVSLESNLSFDSQYLQYISGSGSTSPYAFQINTGAGYKIAGLDTTLSSGIRGQATVFTFTFKALKPGNTSVTLTNVKLNDTDGRVSVSVVPKSITITNPPSSNNNLSSLSTSAGSISFNKNTTSYSVSVGSEVNSATINAIAEDSGASVYGTGSKSLGYGNNTFNVVVTAPSGAKKTYTININRKDNRSSNNNLSSLKIADGNLEPGFSKNNTKYSVSVPYSVTSLSINATAEDSKAKITVSGNSNLVAEESTDVNITVTAENGSQKVYTISAKRGKDPNKKLSDNNYLTNIKPSIGILSPVFNKENEQYEIWLPYEVDKISFEYGVEDTRYATIKFEGNDTLSAGISNIYKITVTAENNEERVYTISVKRAKNPVESNSSNTYLKSIKLKNGKLTSSFNKEKREYYYTSEKDFDISEAIPEDSNSAVSIVKEEDNIYLVVTSSSGEYGVYTLKKKQTNSIGYLIYLLIFGIGFVVGFITHSLVKNKELDKAKEITKSKVEDLEKTREITKPKIKEKNKKNKEN